MVYMTGFCTVAGTEYTVTNQGSEINIKLTQQYKTKGFVLKKQSTICIYSVYSLSLVFLLRPLDFKANSQDGFSASLVSCSHSTNLPSFHWHKAVSSLTDECSQTFASLTALRMIQSKL